MATGRVSHASAQRDGIGTLQQVVVDEHADRPLDGLIRPPFVMTSCYDAPERVPGLHPTE